MTAMSNAIENEFIRCQFRTPPTTADWAATTAYSLGNWAVATTFDGNIYECTTAGTSGGTEPTWNTGLGVTTTDGTVTWTAYKPGMLQKPVYIALFGSTSSLALLEAGTLTGEQTGTSYARKAVVPADANWDAPSGGNGATANTADIVFTAAGAADWDDVYRIAVMDASTGGNVKFAADLTSVKSVGNGKSFTFNAGDLVITVA